VGTALGLDTGVAPVQEMRPLLQDFLTRLLTIDPEALETDDPEGLAVLATTIPRELTLVKMRMDTIEQCSSR
jgi:hypothetical protein